MKLCFFLCCLQMVSPVLAQNLMKERIWKVAPRKKSIYLDAGVFHYETQLQNAQIIGVRNSAVNGRGYERVVIDFSTSSPPKIYGHISSQKKKLSVDFFNTSIKSARPKLKGSDYVEGIDFINVDGKTITMELNLKKKASFDIFYLSNPGRLVIDIR